MNILLTPEEEQLHKFQIELERYSNTQEVFSSPIKPIEENSHRPADINQKITIEDEHLCCQNFGDRSMPEVCIYTQNYIHTELLEK
jgi:hypothetical protein